MDNEKLLALIRAEAQKIAEEVYRNNASQFGVANTSFHTHNNIDSSIIPQFQLVSNGAAGVLSPSNTVGQQVNTNPATLVGKGNSAIYTVPLPIIYGHGSGSASAFNGGDAPDGTLLFFNNGATISGLWVRSAGNWFGIGQSTTGYTNTII